MFDPTIYDNMKVVIEGAVYDLDAQRKILITDRKDIMDLSSMSRTYKIRFELLGSKAAAEIFLYADMSDLASEILESKALKEIGCWLEVFFFTDIRDGKKDGKQIHETLKGIWGTELPMDHTISYPLDLSDKEVTEVSKQYLTIRIRFNRKINEDQLSDINSLLEHVMKSLQQLEQVQRDA